MLSQEEILAFISAPRHPAWFIRHYTELHNACLTLMCHGVRYDLEMAKTKAVELTARKDTIKTELYSLTGGVKLWSETSHLTDEIKALLEAQRGLKSQYDSIPKTDKAARKAFKPQLDTAKEAVRACRDSGKAKWVEIGTGLSDDKICGYLYGDLGIPAFKKKRKESGKITPTADDVTLKKIRIRWPQHTKLVQLIMEHRHANKLLGYLDVNKVDKDGRLRSMYKPFGTQNGRLSSSENPLGTGTNVQNFDRALKTLFIPDPG